MCGRYAATANPDELVHEFEVDEDRTGEPATQRAREPPGAPAGPPRLQHGADQAGPRRALPGAPRRPRRRAAPAQLRLLTWGLVPSWSKDARSALRMINARAESVAGEAGRSPRPPASRRCLVPARGLVRVAGVADGARRQGQAAQAAVLHAPGRRRERAPSPGSTSSGGTRPSADPDDPQAWLTTFTIVTDRRRAGSGPHPRPSAPRPRAGGVGDLAGPGVRGRLTRWVCSSRTDPGGSTAYPVSRAVEQQPAQRTPADRTAPADELVGVVDPMTGEVIGGNG